MIGKLNRRIIIKEWGSMQDDEGGVLPTIINTYPIWAKVENRSGRMFFSEHQRQWNYDYKITFRYEKSRIVHSGMTIDYDGKRLAIESLSYVDEGNRKYCIARCSTQDAGVLAGSGGEPVEPDVLSRLLVEVEAGTASAILAGIIVGASSYTNIRMINRDIEVNRGGYPIANIPQTGDPERAKKDLMSDTVYFSFPIQPGEYFKIVLL